ncbi:uncharacterized protein A4U43_C05F18040 [Asparagus officinalis]|uniref:Uncharacterized protein n=1 Tax=Asparagus officinalis TaxID=4686 RepID=A0A5P1EWV2_ASPOF|nr:uncharacterized protein A4U43_C05F18040 [Asparagus officinalis]
MRESSRSRFWSQIEDTSDLRFGEIAGFAAHKNAIPFREKSFPYYETLAIVFGKDRATGKGVGHSTDVIEELDKEVSQETIREDFIDIDSPSQDAITGCMSDFSLK